MSTRLLVDVGNTRLKLGFAEAGQLVARHELAWQETAFEARLQALLGTLPDAQRVLLSCVAGSATRDRIVRILRAHAGIEPEIATVQRQACGLVNGYRDPGQLGVDRWLGAVAAWRRIAGPVCTIDCGTAMTVNVISERGEFLGGTISAGLGLMHEALAGRTAALALPLAGATAWPATDTDTAIRTGCLEAAAGLAERALRRLRSLSATAAVALVTGGDAPLLMPLLGDGFTHVPGLVLEGLLALSGEPQ